MLVVTDGSKSLILLLVFNSLILSDGLAISPKLDFSNQREIVDVKNNLKGKIKGLRVTVDTSELKGSICDH
jgi:hypothetical protein